MNQVPILSAGRRATGLIRTGVALVLAALLQACQSAESPTFRSVVDTKTLMDAVIERQANIVWESVGTFVSTEGTEERRPQNDEEWKRVRDAAITVTESSNLLLAPPHLQGGDWTQRVNALIDQGQRMIDAATRKDAQAVFDVGADLYEACVACHTSYMPGVKELYMR